MATIDQNGVCLISDVDTSNHRVHIKINGEDDEGMPLISCFKNLQRQNWAFFSA